MLSVYCERESLVDAQSVFDEMSERNMVSWNTIIPASAENDVFLIKLTEWVYLYWAFMVFAKSFQFDYAVVRA